MFYVYCLVSLKNNKRYIGYTSDLKKRFCDHNNCDGGDFTSKNGPWKLIYYEAFLNKKDAQKQEKYFKTGIGRNVLENKLSNYLNDL